VVSAHLISNAEWYLDGRFAPFVRGHRTMGEAVSMLECVQPAGDVSDPPTSDLVLFLSMCEGVPLRWDFGAGLVRTHMVPAHFSLVPPGVPAECRVDGPNAFRAFALPQARYVAALSDARPNRDPFDFGRLHAQACSSQSIIRVLEELWADTVEDGASQLFAESAALSILAELTRMADGPAKPANGGLAPWAARRCTEYLRTNAAREISLSELAGLAGLSPFHFARMFKQTIGVPPHAYQRRARCEKAQELLLSSNLSIIEIAGIVGYETPQAFARMFRAEIGQSPSAWRRALRA
jgi:AraC family transcriptional regulator